SMGILPKPFMEKVMASCRFPCVAVLAVSVWGAAVLPFRADEKTTASVAHIKLTGSLDEVPVSQDPLFGSLENFKSKLDRIAKARKDKTVQALYLQIDGLDIGWGKVDELRRAIADFRKAGKKAYAYLEAGSTKDYLVASACDRICLPESGWLMLTGIQAEVMFYKGLLDKIGVQADMLQMGEYKGAAEPFTRSEMSKPFRERLESVLKDYYEESLVKVITQGRKGLSADLVKKLIDEG